MDLEQAPAFIRFRFYFSIFYFYNINFIKIKNDVDIVIEYISNEGTERLRNEVPVMLFRNYNIDNIPVIKRMCKTILEGFLANRNHFTMNDESNLLTDYIKEVMARKSEVEKENAMKSMSNIYEDAYYRSLMEQLGDYYDITEPLLIICDNICKYHYTELYPCGWDENGEGIWIRPSVDMVASVASAAASS
jgi:hypothetical protein